MAEENKNIKVDLNQTSDDDLDKAIIQTQVSGENEPVVEINEPVIPKTEDAVEPYLVKIEYPEKGGDKKPEVQPKQEPVKAVEPTAEETAFKTLQVQIPELLKYKSLDEYKTSIATPAEQKQLETKKEPEVTAENIELTEQEMGVINASAFKYAQQDAEILALVQSAVRRSTKKAEDDEDYKPLTGFPRTRGDYDKILDLDPSLHSELVKKIAGLKNDLITTAKDYKTQVITAPKKNEEVAVNFAKRIEGYVAKVHKDYKPEDVKELVQKMEGFFEKAKGDAKYYVKDKGVPVLNENLLYADFITQEADTFSKLSALAQRKNGSGGDMKQILENQTKGVSQKTLVNQGLSGRDSGIVDLNKPSDQAGLSDAELDAMLDLTKKEILTEK